MGITGFPAKPYDSVASFSSRGPQDFLTPFDGMTQIDRTISWQRVRNIVDPPVSR